MRSLYATALALFIFIAPSAYAGVSGSGHSHGAPISGEQATQNAAKIVENLIGKGKIDPSWSEVDATGAEQKKYAKATEWVVTFANPAITDPEKQTLYVFLTLQGDYVAANHSGK